jgi:hypothetical protein
MIARRVLKKTISRRPFDRKKAIDTIPRNL